jgi:hypothetical protein
MNKLRETAVNPVFAIVGILVIAALFGYFFWLRPAQEEATAVKEWTSPEGLAKRGPDKVVDPQYQSKVQELLKKEGKENTAGLGRRRDRD